MNVLTDPERVRKVDENQMPYTVTTNEYLPKGKRAEGAGPAEKYSARYVTAEDWKPADIAEGVSILSEFMKEHEILALLHFGLNRFFQNADQPGMDPLEKKARELSKITGKSFEVCLEAVKALAS